MLETQFSLSERVACIHHTLTMSASSTISHQEAEFAVSAMMSVIKLFTVLSKPLFVYWKPIFLP